MCVLPFHEHGWNRDPENLGNRGKIGCGMDVLSLDQEVGAWDSVLLDPLTEESFITNLHQRFKRDHIYTYIGNVLVSVNPYKKLALYSGELVKAYRCRGPYQLPPHIYAIAGSAYRFLRDRNEDQCIVVSGESGAGKTEAAHIVLQFVALASGHSREVKIMKERLVQAGPLLEAFGNAKTYRNDNSSRFGKYLDIEFDYKGDPLGGTVTNFKGNMSGSRGEELSYFLSVADWC